MLVLDLESSGLDPTVNFITMIGVMDDDGVRIFSAPAQEFRKDPFHAEKKILQSVSDANFRHTDLLLTYNGANFDNPFLNTRFMAHQIPPPAFIGIKRHMDLMLYATHLNGGTRISKDMAAHKFCNLYVPKNSSGAFLAQIYNQRIVSDVQHADAMFHNANDLHTTFQMFQVWKGFPTFEKFYSEKYPNIREWLYA